MRGYVGMVRFAYLLPLLWLEWRWEDGEGAIGEF